MAPTEILAEQHYNSFVKLFAGTGVNVELLTGGNTAAQKRRIKDAVVTGACDLVVGTHALLSDTVEFYKLGLVITDEQHRFGVMQRNVIIGKGLQLDERKQQYQRKYNLLHHSYLLVFPKLPDDAGIMNILGLAAVVPDSKGQDHRCRDGGGHSVRFRYGQGHDEWRIL